MANIRARPGEALFGAMLLGVGLFAIYEASALPFGSWSEPDAGFFPVAIGVVLTVFAALSFTARPAPAGESERAGLLRVAVLIVATGVYAWFLPSVGFLICTFILLGLVLRGLGRVGWMATGIAAASGAVGCYFLFTRLGMPLPAGVLGF